MNLKDLFAKSETGTLTYDQFVALATESKSKFVDLSEGNYVDKQKYTDDLASRDTRISTLDETIKSRETDLQNLQEQLKNAGTDNEKLAKLGTDFTELQKRYDADTKKYEQQLREQAYKYAVNDFANQQKFTSKAAKRDFVNAMIGKNLQMEGDTIIGATDFVAAYTRENEDAFAIDTPAEDLAKEPKPHFTNPINGSDDNGEKVTPFQFNFTGVRPHEK